MVEIYGTFIFHTQYNKYTIEYMANKDNFSIIKEHAMYCAPAGGLGISPSLLASLIGK